MVVSRENAVSSKMPSLRRFAVAILVISLYVLYVQARHKKFCDRSKNYRYCTANKDCRSKRCNKTYKRCVPPKEGFKSRVQIRNSIYFMEERLELNWKKSLQFCQKKSMDLLMRDSMFQLENLAAYLENEGFINDPSHSGMGYLFWTNSATQGKNRPDRKCVEFGYMDNGLLRNNDCDLKRHIICVKKGSENNESSECVNPASNESKSSDSSKSDDSDYGNSDGSDGDYGSSNESNGGIVSPGIKIVEGNDGTRNISIGGRGGIQIQNTNGTKQTVLGGPGGIQILDINGKKQTVLGGPGGIIIRNETGRGKNSSWDTSFTNFWGTNVSGSIPGNLSNLGGIGGQLGVMNTSDPFDTPFFRANTNTLSTHTQSKVSEGSVNWINQTSHNTMKMN